MAELSLLQTFVAVHRAGSVTAAARELHLSQPAVSMQLKSLEQLVGRPLFRRLPRGVQPTAAGDQLARQVAAHLDALHTAVAFAQGPERHAPARPVHVGGPGELLGARAIPALSELVGEGMRLRLLVGEDDNIVPLLRAGELDLAVTTREWQVRGLGSEPLCQEQFVLVGSPALVGTVGRLQRGSGGARALRNVPLVAYAEQLPLVREYWRHAFDTRIDRVAHVVVNSLPAVLASVAAGCGISVLPLHACDVALEAGLVALLQSPASGPRSTLYLTWREAALRDPGVLAVYERLRDAAPSWS